MPIQPSGSRDAPSASPPEPQGWASQSQRLSFHQGSEGGGGARGPWEEFVSNPPKAAHVALAAPHSARFGNRTNYNMEAAALFALGGVRRGEKVVLVGSHWHYPVQLPAAGRRPGGRRVRAAGRVAVSHAPRPL